MIELIYTKLMDIMPQIIRQSVPYLRRFLRFIALPYCYLFTINWNECTESRLIVMKDLLYIFFKLKYYPDNYSLCRLWEKDKVLWPYYYGSIYDPYQRMKLSKEVQPSEYKIIFEDKYICYQLCKAGGIPQPQQYDIIDIYDNYKEYISEIHFTNNESKLIIKPIRGMGGKGIIQSYMKDGKVFVRNIDKEIHIDGFELKHRSVVQTYIQQHDALSIMSHATSTVRIVTLLTRDREVVVVGALMRFSNGHSYVDNTSQGGIAVGVDIERGCLKKYGYDFSSRIYEAHPRSNISFQYFDIPLWLDVINLARKVQLLFPYYRLLGQDIAISQAGPLLIEINGEHDNVGLEQSFGPIFANHSLIQEFDKYDLLVNNVLINKLNSKSTI